MAQSSKGTAAGAGWDAGLYEAKHAFVWQLAAGLVELLAPKPGERVLDLGAGTGQLTATLADSGAEVIGIDHSEQMVAQARRNYPALRFEVGDARTFSVDAPVDAVFSNAVLHWVKPPGAGDAVGRVWLALRPGGRFVAEFGGSGNIANLMAAMRGAMEELGLPSFDALNPWYYPTVGQYATLLEGRGFDVTFATLFDRPTPLEGETGLRDWVRMFGGVFLGAVRAEDHERFFHAVERRAGPTLLRDGTWHADYRRLRVVAVKPL